MNEYNLNNELAPSIRPNDSYSREAIKFTENQFLRFDCKIESNGFTFEKYSSIAFKICSGT